MTRFLNYTRIQGDSRGRVATHLIMTDYPIYNTRQFLKICDSKALKSKK